MINIAICDDETGTCAEIENMILDYAKSHGLHMETEVFYSGESLYSCLKNGIRFDIIFLDIQLFELDGVQVGRQIREQLGDENISIVYISSKESYAMSLFQVRPLDFLIKPITSEKAAAVLDKFIQIHEANKQEFYFKTGKSICKCYLSDICYFACSGKKIEIHSTRETKEFYGSMKEVWRPTEGKGFWMIHKSYVVNAAYVSVYHYDSLQMTDGTILPISQKYRKDMRENLLEKYREG